MEQLWIFLNSKLFLLLAATIIGAVGLFTWQRSDWVAKQQYLRAQVLLDRRIQLVERINTDVGMLIARADGVVAIIGKQPSGSAQRNQVIAEYNAEQAEWFGQAVSHQALLEFYFPPVVGERFGAEIVEATKVLDGAIYWYGKENTAENRQEAKDTSQAVRDHLQTWNTLAFEELAAK